MGKVCSKCLGKRKEKYRKDEDRPRIAQNEQRGDGGKILTNKGAAIDPRDLSEVTAPDIKRTEEKTQPGGETPANNTEESPRRRHRRRHHSPDDSTDTSTSSSDSDDGPRRHSKRRGGGARTIITKTINNYGTSNTIKNVDKVVIYTGKPRPPKPKPVKTPDQQNRAEQSKPNPVPSGGCREFFSSYHDEASLHELSRPVTASPSTDPSGFSLPQLGVFDDATKLKQVLQMDGSVCKLTYWEEFCTGIRVGRDKLIIPLHGLKVMLQPEISDFARRHDNTRSQFERLKSERIYAVFNHDSSNTEPVKFFLDGEVHFWHEETDTAVVSLLPNRDGHPMPEPFKYFSIPRNEFVFIGHPNGEKKQIESVKKIVRLNDITKREIQELRLWSDKFGRPYDEPRTADSVHRLLFHSNMVNGASGSPGLTVVDGDRVVVVTLFLHKYPDWEFDPDVPQAEKNKIHDNYRISQGANMYSVYYEMLNEAQELCNEIFHSWQDN